MLNPTKEEWQKLHDLVQSFHQRPEAAPFRSPDYPWHQVGDGNYTEVIKEPMDLETVLTRLRSNTYKTFYDTFIDVRKIWLNCILYDEKNASNYFRFALLLNKHWDKAYFDLVRKCRQDPVDFSKFDRHSWILEQRAFSHILNTLSDLQLMDVVAKIESLYPDSITRGGVRFSLDVDKLPPTFLKDMILFSKSLHGENKSKRKNKAPESI